MASKKKYVVEKMGKFATVGGGLGGRPKVYDSVQSAQHDIDSIPKLKGGAVKPYTDPDVSGEPGVKMATTSKAKAAAVKANKAVTPKRAAAGK